MPRHGKTKVAKKKMMRGGVMPKKMRGGGKMKMARGGKPKMMRGGGMSMMKKPKK